MEPGPPPAGPAAQAPSARPPFRWRRTVAALGLLVVTGLAVGLAVLASTSVAAVGLVGWLLAPMVDEAVVANCILEVDEVCARLAAATATPGRDAALAELRAQGGRTCREGDVSLLDVAMLGAQVEDSLQDGLVSEAEAQSLIAWWQAQHR
jgi:hypothetical protein